MMGVAGFFAGTALIAYMSGLTGVGFAASTDGGYILPGFLPAFETQDGALDPAKFPAA